MLGEVELVEVGAHGRVRKSLVPELRDRRVAVALRELLPVLAEHEPVVDHLGELAAERARDPLLDLEVRPVVVAADDMGDPEVEIVGDRRELVRRRPVRRGGASCRRAPSRTEPSASRSAAPPSSARSAASA